jgi:hypothetical protein
MPDRPARRRTGGLLPVFAAALAALLLLASATPLLAAPPFETCAPGETTRPAEGFDDLCGADSPGTGGGGGGGLDLGALLPILGVVGAGGIAALIAAFVVLRRTSAPMTPADPGEWWTCRTCGKTNVVGSARCYACGAWQR